MDVRTLKFDKSAHVQHLLRHPERYSEAIHSMVEHVTRKNES